MKGANMTTKLRRIRIEKDEDCNPRKDFDNLGVMLCRHSRYNLGDEDAEEPDEDAEVSAEIFSLPLYLYDHSGLSMNTTGFNDRWDSGQVGMIYCTLEAARENWLQPDATWDTLLPTGDGEEITMREYAIRVMQAEVEQYNQYLQGDVYGFVVEECDKCECCGHEEWSEVDSCGGFYGSDPFENGMSEYVDESEHDLLRAA